MRALACLALGIVLTASAGEAEAQDRPLPAEDRSNATECLTLAIAYEAGYETTEGKQAVAEVMLNRLRDPSFPKTVCEVVFAGSSRRTGCQFTFTCDGSLYRRRLPAAVLEAARAVANEALAGRLPSRVPRATHYHADYVHPYWASSLIRLTKIGAHIFYYGTGRGELPGTTGPSLPGGSDGNSQSAANGANAPRPEPAFEPWGLTLQPRAPGRQ